jgi:hypothetical protein
MRAREGGREGGREGTRKRARPISLQGIMSTMVSPSDHENTTMSCVKATLRAFVLCAARAFSTVISVMTLSSLETHGFIRARAQRLTGTDGAICSIFALICAMRKYLLSSLKHLKLILEIDAHFRVLDAVHWFGHRCLLINLQPFKASACRFFFCLHLNREERCRGHQSLRVSCEYGSPMHCMNCTSLPSVTTLSCTRGDLSQIIRLSQRNITCCMRAKVPMASCADIEATVFGF